MPLNQDSILATGDLLEHISPSTFQCRWWRKCRQEKLKSLFLGHDQVRDESWEWSVQSDTFPDDATCRRLGPDDCKLVFYLYNS